MQNHFLPEKGNTLTVFTEEENDLSDGKMYFVSPDGALREGRDNTQPLLPPFTSNRGRAEKDILNPFLVVLNAEIAFRRFREQPRRVLCQEYNELIDLTIDLMDKIYFQPVIEAEREEMDDLYKDVDLDRPRELPKNSRMGVVVKKPGRDASVDEVIEYHRYLMSGCDYIDDSDGDNDADDDEDHESFNDEEDENGSVYQEHQGYKDGVFYETKQNTDNFHKISVKSGSIPLCTSLTT
ncbi:hypothetical protein D9613_012773 [Agrocybe pediades]|uniref:Uncharacterized protein n=1 Tax=Agrocybe pediades TaxID=84607 RepID=A0A8H4VJW4_9AGAR|nr:hypothetical protein D9613_012773 [Agrocybe pediades]